MIRLATLALIGSLVACGTTEESADSMLTIGNASSYTFVEINLSPIDRISWGADLLGDTVLLPGQSLELSGVACDVYDIRIVDEDGDQCILDTVDLCLDKAVWRIDDAELASCVF